VNDHVATSGKAFEVRDPQGLLRIVLHHLFECFTDDPEFLSTAARNMESCS
jgi:hypothetical protein